MNPHSHYQPIPVHDAIGRRADHLIVSCLARFPYALRGSIPYLMELLRAGDDDLAFGVLRYIRSSNLVDAAPALRRTLQGKRVSLRILHEGTLVLASLDAVRTEGHRS